MEKYRFYLDLPGDFWESGALLRYLREREVQVRCLQFGFQVSRFRREVFELVHVRLVELLLLHKRLRREMRR